MNNSNQLIILILSIAFIVYGIYQIKDFIIRRIKCKIGVDATIIDLKKTVIKRSKGSLKREYSPVVEFRANDGKLYNATAKETTVIASKYRIGQLVSIKYSESNPELIYLQGKYNGVLSGMVITLLGILMMIAYVFTL